MINKIRSWFKKRDLELIEVVRNMIEEESKKPLADWEKNPPLNLSRILKQDTLTLLKHQLGSVDLKDLDQEDMSESERKAYVSHISGVYDYLEKDIKRFLYEQLMFMSNNAENWDQVVFGRGTFNGIDLLRNHWKKAREEHIANIQPEEEFDKHELLPK